MSNNQRRVWEPGPGGWTSREADREDKRVRLAQEIGFPIDRPSLPDTYERARQALAECVRVDEVKQWHDKAQALNTYARQVHDDDLMKLALRIRARALRQAGFILTEHNLRGWHRKKEYRDGQRPPTQDEICKAVGFTKNQKEYAIRFARISDEKFDEMVEAAKPPPLGQMSLAGRRHTVPYRSTAEQVPDGATPIWPSHDAIRNLRDTTQRWLRRHCDPKQARTVRKALRELGPLDTSERE